MNFEERLAGVLEDGDSELAESFVRGVLGSQDCTAIRLTDEGVRVETKSFVGVHTLEPSAAEIRARWEDTDKEPVAIDDVHIPRSEYQVRSDEVSYTLTGTQLHHVNVETYLEQEYCTASQSTSEKSPFTHPTSRKARAGVTPDDTDDESEEANTNADREANAESTNGGPESVTSTPPRSDGGQTQPLTKRVGHWIQRRLL